MRVTYAPTGINNFHNSAPITLVVTGETVNDGDGPRYIITGRQAKRVERHFCGITDCRCAAGAARQMDEGGTVYGILTSYCS